MKRSVLLPAAALVACLPASLASAVGGFTLTATPGSSTVAYSFSGSFVHDNNAQTFTPTTLFFGNVDFAALSGGFTATFGTAHGASGELVVNGVSTPLSSIQFSSGGGAPDDILLTFAAGPTLSGTLDDNISFSGAGVLDISPFTAGTDLLLGSGTFSSMTMNSASQSDTGPYTWVNLVPEPATAAWLGAGLGLAMLRRRQPAG